MCAQWLFHYHPNTTKNLNEILIPICFIPQIINFIGLSELDVSNNIEMEASGLESLLKLCSKKLEKLDISNFPKESEADSLRGLVNFCKMDKLGIDLEQLSIRSVYTLIFFSFSA